MGELVRATTTPAEKYLANSETVALRLWMAGTCEKSARAGTAEARERLRLVATMVCLYRCCVHETTG